MDIQFSKRFLKQLTKQSTKVQRAFYTRLRLFEEDLTNPMLHNHALRGEFKGYYSINVTGDVRALYEIIEDEIYIYALIGTHSQLYG